MKTMLFQIDRDPCVHRIKISLPSPDPHHRRTVHFNTNLSPIHMYSIDTSVLKKIVEGLHFFFPSRLICNLNMSYPPPPGPGAPGWGGVPPAGFNSQVPGPPGMGLFGPQGGLGHDALRQMWNTIGGTTYPPGGQYPGSFPPASQPAPGFAAAHPALGFAAIHPALGFAAGQPAPGFAAGQPAPGFAAGQPAPGFAAGQPTPGFAGQPTPGFAGQPAPGFAGHPAPGFAGHPAPGFAVGQPGYPSQMAPENIPAVPYAVPGQPQQPPSQSYADPLPKATSNPSPKAASTIQYHGRPTVRPDPAFDPQRDAAVLRKAMRGFGTDEKAIIDVVARRSNQQRQQVLLAFKTAYGKDLLKELESELSGNFLKVVLGLMETPTRFAVHQLDEAMKGAGTNEKCLIEILASSSSEEINDIKKMYKAEFKRSLEDDIISETSGNFKNLLVGLVQGGRDADAVVDVAIAEKDAKDLYNAGEARWGTDESKFNALLLARNKQHLLRVFEEYKHVCKYDIEESIKREMSGDLKNGMLAVVKCIRKPTAFFAESLYTSMKGLGTDDQTLIRVMVSRCDVDLADIKEEFRSRYGKSLYSFIKGDTSGDYRRILLELCGGEN
uniref:Annexin n=1 Tax=Eptatretus burgeri TaxID=7764 RepID=A0A8C4QK78_EPTBU